MFYVPVLLRCILDSLNASDASTSSAFASIVDISWATSFMMPAFNAASTVSTGAGDFSSALSSNERALKFEVQMLTDRVNSLTKDLQRQRELCDKTLSLFNDKNDEYLRMELHYQNMLRAERMKREDVERALMVATSDDKIVLAAGNVGGVVV